MENRHLNVRALIIFLVKVLDLGCIFDYELVSSKAAACTMHFRIEFPLNKLLTLLFGIELGSVLISGLIQVEKFGFTRRS